jgi:hypothetical protein
VTFSTCVEDASEYTPTGRDEFEQGIFSFLTKEKIEVINLKDHLQDMKENSHAGMKKRK